MKFIANSTFTGEIPKPLFPNSENGRILTLAASIQHSIVILAKAIRQEIKDIQIRNK